MLGMNQEGLLFPKGTIRKKTKEAPQKYHRQRCKRSVFHLRKNRLYGMPSHLWQCKPQILRAIWLNRVSLPGMPQNIRYSRT
nr:MAG TPA: hypothetical protein [Caudoviricetes sp.]